MIRIGMFLGDRYEILEKIGSGGMADVFKGKDHKLNRFVAVKVLKDEFVEDRNFVRKFKEEAQAAAALAHPNIVNVYDVGDEQNIKYIVMELVEGITLKNYIERKGRLTVKEATSIAIQVSAGLEIAHNNQIVHRDIKPQNIIISKEGKVKVTDFGIAKSASSNTNTSDAMGSVHYISPEQARGGYSDAKSDIYSLGIVLYEMVTGRVPFDGDTSVAVAVKHLQEEIVPPRVYASNVPVSLEQIILKCTAKSPDRRYVNIAELQADLKQSLITPDENFVKSMAAGGAKTVALSHDDITRIKEETGRIHLPKSGYEMEEDDPFADVEDEYDRYDDEDEYDRYDDDDEYDDEYDDDGYDDDDYDDDEYENDREEDEEDDGGLDPRLEKIMTIGGIVAAVIILLIVVVIVVKMFGVGRSSKDDEPKEDDIQLIDVVDDEEGVEVPDLLGMSYSEAKAALNDLGLGIGFGETRESNEYEEGQIIGQSVEKGTKVEKNTQIMVDICGGSQELAVPDVVGLAELEAQNKLTAEGFIPDISTEFSENVAEGKVISTSPKGGTSASQGSVVKVIVSKGPEQNKVPVPDIKGGTESRAKEKLTAAKLSVGNVTQEFSDSVQEGYVISQSISPNTQVPEGTAVSFVVSKGPEIKEVYIGNAEQGGSSKEAVAKYLTDKGLKVVYKEEYSSTIPAGNVVSYSPGNGSTVKQGTTVTVVVSLGKEPQPEPPTPPVTDPEPPATSSDTDGTGEGA